MTTKRKPVGNQSKVPNPIDRLPAAMRSQPINGISYDTKATNYHELRDIADHATNHAALSVLVGEMSNSIWKVSRCQGSCWEPNDGRSVDEAIQILQKIVDDERNVLCEQMYRESLIYGFCCAEIIDQWNEVDLVWEPQLKPVLQEFTWICQDRHGAFIGFIDKTISPYAMPDGIATISCGELTATPFHFIPAFNAILVNYAQRGDNLYGRSLLDPIRPLWRDFLSYRKKLSSFVAMQSFSIVEMIYKETGDGFGENDDAFEVEHARRVRTMNDVAAALEKGQAVFVENVVSDDGVKAFRFDVTNIPLVGNIGDIYTAISRVQDEMVMGIGEPPEKLRNGANGSYANSVMLDKTQRIAMSGPERRFMEQVQNLLDHVTMLNWGVEGVVTVTTTEYDAAREFTEKNFQSIISIPDVDRIAMLKDVGIPVLESNDSIIHEEAITTASMVGARPSSSAIGQTVYNTETGDLSYRYRSGPNVYSTNIDSETYNQMLASDSKGRFFNENIKPKWSGEKLPTLPNIDVTAGNVAGRKQKDQTERDDSTSWTSEFWKRVQKELRESIPPNYQEIDRLTEKQKNVRRDILEQQLQHSFDAKDAASYAVSLTEYRYLTGEVPPGTIAAEKRGDIVLPPIRKKSTSWFVNDFVNRLLRNKK